MIIVNSCNNPTGVVYDAEVLLYLFCEAKKLGVWVISDSTYEFLRYKNNFCCSESHKLQAHENVVHLYSFSKLFNVPGYRLGFIVCADKGLMSKMIASNSALISCHSEFTQLGVLAGIPELRPFAANQARYYSNVVAEIGVAWPTLLDCIEAEPSSGFYLFLPIWRFGISDSDSFCRGLLYNKGVVVTPGTSFGKDGYVRLAVCGSKPKVLNGIDMMMSFLAKY